MFRTWTRPLERATQTLQSIASSLVGRELALLRPTHQQLFAGLVEHSERDLTSAEQEFARFKVATGIASVGENEAALLRQLEGSSVQSATLAAELAEERRQTANEPMTSSRSCRRGWSEQNRIPLLTSRRDRVLV